MFGNNRTKLILQLAQGASETHEAQQIDTKCTTEEKKSTTEVLLVDTSTSTVEISNSDWHYTIEEFDPFSTVTKISADSLSEKDDTLSTTKNENAKMTPEEECSQEFQHESVQPQVCMAPNSQERQIIPGPLFTPLSSDVITMRQQTMLSAQDRGKSMSHQKMKINEKLFQKWKQSFHQIMKRKDRS